MSIALSLCDVKKKYKKGNINALKGINLDIKEQDFFALLGPNGAGKSTLIGIITSLINKSYGSIKVFGKDLDTHPYLVKSYIGVVPQELNVNIFEKVIDILINQAGYYGIPKKIAIKDAEIILRELQLWDKRNTQSMYLSGGMKRRLMIARALIHKPKLLILDEPTAGVDIELRRSMWDYIIKLNKKEKVTIILTTHYLEEAENFCKNVAIIDHGEIIACSKISELIRKLDTHQISFDLLHELNQIPQSLKTNQEVDFTLEDSMTLNVEIKKNMDLNTVINILDRHNIKINSVKNKANRLEELFIKITNNAS